MKNKTHYRVEHKERRGTVIGWWHNPTTDNRSSLRRAIARAKQVAWEEYTDVRIVKVQHIETALSIKIKPTF